MPPNVVPDPFAKLDVFAFRADLLKFDGALPGLDVTVFAAKRNAGDAILDALPWLCTTAFAVGVLIAAMIVFRFLRNWKLDDPDSEETLRSKFRDLHRQGELSAEEYREIQVSLAEQMLRKAEEEAEKKR